MLSFRRFHLQSLIVASVSIRHCASSSPTAPTDTESDNTSQQPGRRRVRVVVRKLENNNSISSDENNTSSNDTVKNASHSENSETAATASSSSIYQTRQKQQQNQPGEDDTIPTRSVTQIASMSDSHLEQLWSTFSPQADKTLVSDYFRSNYRSVEDDQQQVMARKNNNTNVDFEDDDDDIAARRLSSTSSGSPSSSRSFNSSRKGQKFHKLSKDLSQLTSKIQNQDFSPMGIQKRQIQSELNSRNTHHHEDNSTTTKRGNHSTSNKYSSSSTWQEKEKPRMTPPSLPHASVLPKIVQKEGSINTSSRSQKKSMMSKPKFFSRNQYDEVEETSDEVPQQSSTQQQSSSSSSSSLFPSSSSLGSSSAWGTENTFTSSTSSPPPYHKFGIEKKDISKKKRKDAVDVLLSEIPEQYAADLQQKARNNNNNGQLPPDFDNDDDDGWSLFSSSTTGHQQQQSHENVTTDNHRHHQQNFPPQQHQRNIRRGGGGGGGGGNIKSSLINRTTIIDDIPSSSLSSLDHSSKRNYSTTSLSSTRRTHHHHHQHTHYLNLFRTTSTLLQRSQQIFRRIETIQQYADQHDKDEDMRRRQSKKSAATVAGKHRSDEFYLGQIVHKIFSEMSTDGNRLPVSKCISYLFDNAIQNTSNAQLVAFANSTTTSGDAEKKDSNNITTAPLSSSQSSSSSLSASLNMKQLADFFAPSKPLTFVPASVKKEVRSRFQQQGGLLKFIENNLSGRFAISKDPVTSELQITVRVHDPFSSTFGEDQQYSNNNIIHQGEEESPTSSSSNPVSSSSSTENNSNEWKPWSSSFGDYADTQKFSPASSAAASVAKPWNTSHQRVQLQLSWTERVPVDKNQVDTYLDMLAAGARPIYGDEWYYHGGIFFGGFNNQATNSKYYSSSSSSSGGGGGPVHDHNNMVQPRVFRTKEVADFFVEHTPTFWVLERQLARSLAERFPEVLEESGFSKVEDFFERYPKIFEIYFDGDPRAREVRLNPSFNRNHPRRGAADKVWELRASPKAEDEALNAQDRHFGKILLENLAKQENEGLFVFLPEWIRRSFSDQDRATINSAPPQRTLMILNRYANLFQIRSHETDPPLPHQQKRFVDLTTTTTTTTCDNQEQEQTEAVEVAEGQEQEKTSSSSNPTAAASSSPLSLEEEYEHIPNEFRIWVRRRPTHLAPRCLDEFDVETSPAPLLARYLIDTITDMVREKREKETTSNNINKEENINININEDINNTEELQQKHEINIQDLYSKLQKDHRQMLRPFSSLAKFLRLHGQVFSVSTDLSRVALHRWDGASQAFATIDSLLAEEEKSSPFVPDNNLAFKPRTRKQLTHLDPNNPFLNRAFLQKSIHDALPEHSAVLVTDLFKRMMPAEAWAALPTRNPHSVLLATPLLTVWKAHDNSSNGKRRLMIQRGELGAAPKGCGLGECASKEEVITQIQELLATVHPNGMSVRTLHEKLRWDAIVGIKEHFKSIDACLKKYPQMFEIEVPREVGDTLQEVGAFACVVYLKTAAGK